jgi:hypothetical protein
MDKEAGLQISRSASVRNDEKGTLALPASDYYTFQRTPSVRSLPEDRKSALRSYSRSWRDVEMEKISDKRASKGLVTFHHSAKELRPNKFLEANSSNVSSTEDALNEQHMKPRKSTPRPAKGISLTLLTVYKADHSTRMPVNLNKVETENF